MNFGKYTAEKKLGKGAMGEVFYGIHPNLDIPIAIKTLAKSLVDDELFVDRFIREAKMAAQLRHENAIMIYDADHDEENHFIVMEFVAGGDLKDLIEKEGSLPEKEALRITKCVASALQAAAKYGIIHRDIKPDNIMLAEDGTPKLADLGIARQNVDGQVNTTMTGVIVGTPSYLAPEQAHDSKTVDARADIYALGCTLYKMLSGKCPYEGNTALSVMMKHINEPIPDIRQEVPEVSEYTAELLQKMMAKSPEDRPSSAAELIKLIDDFKRSPEPPPKKVEPVKKEVAVSGKAYTATLVLAGLILVLVLAIVFLPGNSQPQQENTVDAKTNVEVQAPSPASSIDSIMIKDLGIEMIPVKATTFMMGAQEGEAQTDADETLHSVTISSDYYLSKLELSVGAWKAFSDATAYSTAAESRGWSSFYDSQGRWEQRVADVNWKNINLEDDDAISMITYEDALEFCKWLTAREKTAGRLPEGYEYTLPTEAQWENACRAASSTPYANGKTVDQLGWTAENSSRRVHKRGLKEANDWGFYDMHGNVWEFCLDRSEGQGYFDVSTSVYRDGVTDPLSTTGRKSINRGGSYPDREELCRSASRSHGALTYSSNNHGIRLCLSKIRE
ncbi:MAG: bifunctional serine/threonine-protein kinase/formylglycine-generating enzyme family protein [Lentisphaeraceae bacterium]|nr:bifunctional serine/threonine-protein kinase/formylglycine-generating enzyme family protein [Lentisphaeraceae bacterium]